MIRKSYLPFFSVSLCSVLDILFVQIY
jgi:hypothetical protein